jgi:predicted 3-demethylubiquinone-9 3-methyltransferase (glyoxalase superfamily)
VAKWNGVLLEEVIMSEQKIVPSLWFDKEAEEAAKLYTSLFENSEIGDSARYSEAGQEVHRQEPGSVMTVEYALDGYRFSALNGGPDFKFNPSISFFVNRESEDEVDALWEELAQDGSVLMPLQAYPFSKRYGWLADRYGLSWQVSVSDDGRSSIIPSLMFVGDKTGQAEAAIDFYTLVFSDSKVGEIFRYSAGQEPDKEGTVAYGPFVLAGQDFVAMDSAREHDFSFNEAISLIVNCEDQAEVDYYWERLSAVPESEQCGWLKDRFGVSWQIVPTVLGELMTDPDRAKADRVMEAVLQMKKLDIDELHVAADNG